MYSEALKAGGFAVVTGAAVARMTLYKHFRSKDGLVQATVVHHTERFLEYLRENMANGSDAVEGLVNAFARWWQGESPFQPCLCGSVRS